MKKIHLIMPMGGSGSRFFKNGFMVPKPLIEINGKPFLYWSTRSIQKFVDIQDLTFVVLREHIDNFEIDKIIYKYFKNAQIIIIPKVLNGAVLTCLEGLKNINDDLPIVFNDCDHLFKCSSFNDFCNKGEFNTIDGALLTFKSTDPKFSFLKLNLDGKVVRTVEKEAISNLAICGAYYFKNAETVKKYAEKYLKKCQYNEYFISGVYNIMASDNKEIIPFEVDYHLAFGTPEEYKEAKESDKFLEIN